jgi:pimeloyl-ACP methyl ester carboxylesterase
MALVRVADVGVNVREWGTPGSPALLFWHALGPAASAETANEIGPALAARDRRLVGIDGPGFGGSPLLPPERYRLEDLAQLALGVADALAIGRFALIGHSWGGAVAFMAARQAPERVEGLVLLDSGHIDYGSLPDVETGRSAEEWIAAAPSFEWPSEEAFAADLRDGVRRFTPAVLAAYRAGLHDGAAGVLSGSPAEARGAAMAGLTAPVSRAWPVVRERGIPVLLFLATDPPHGDQNRAHVGRFSEALPNAEIRWIEDAGHGLLTDVGPPLAVEIADWLDALA